MSVDKPGANAGSNSGRAERAARLAEALRANLRKRKAQMRQRADARSSSGTTEPGDDQASR